MQVKIVNNAKIAHFGQENDFKMLKKPPYKSYTTLASQSIEMYEARKNKLIFKILKVPISFIFKQIYKLAKLSLNEAKSISGKANGFTKKRIIIPTVIAARIDFIKAASANFSP